MKNFFKKKNTLFIIFVAMLHVPASMLQTNFRPQKRSTESIGDVQKAKVTSPISNQFQRRLLPRTEMLQKVQNLSQTLKTKPTSRGSNVDELDDNEINRLTDINYTPDRLADDFWKQGDCTTCQDESSSVPNRWTMPLLKSGDKRYYLGTFFKANWYRAAQFCRYHGMNLASINNQEENDKLEKYVTDFGYGFEHFWTSGTDLAEEGSFFWMSTGRPIIFTNWNAGEPNNFKYENGEEEHCMELWNRDGKGLKWNDSPCSFETYFICEI